jgi:hypothetical protein
MKIYLLWGVLEIINFIKSEREVKTIREIKRS